jgi:hypothetical protein
MVPPEPFARQAERLSERERPAAGFERQAAPLAAVRPAAVQIVLRPVQAAGLEPMTARREARAVLRAEPVGAAVRRAAAIPAEAFRRADARSVA